MRAPRLPRLPLHLPHAREARAVLGGADVRVRRWEPAACRVACISIYPSVKKGRAERSPRADMVQHYHLSPDPPRERPRHLGRVSGSVHGASVSQSINRAGGAHHDAQSAPHLPRRASSLSPPQHLRPLSKRPPHRTAHPCPHTHSHAPPPPHTSRTARLPGPGAHAQRMFGRTACA